MLNFDSFYFEIIYFSFTFLRFPKFFIVFKKVKILHFDLINFYYFYFDSFNFKFSVLYFYDCIFSMQFLC